MKERKTLSISTLDLNSGTQNRPLSQDTVDRYVEDMKEGDIFPPIEVIREGGKYYVWDGFHREKAHRVLGKEQIVANVEEGTLRQAIWKSFGANAHHGLPRSERNVAVILGRIFEDVRWRKKSVRAIAEQVGCGKTYVHKMRQKFFGESESEPDTDDETTKGKPEKPTDEKKEPEREPKSPMVDCLGNKIPARLNDYWLSRAAISKQVQILEGIKNVIAHSIENSEPTYTKMSFANFKATYEKLHDIMCNAKPYAICPYCRGKLCDKCHHFGFVTEAVWKIIPREDKGV